MVGVISDRTRYLSSREFEKKAQRNLLHATHSSLHGHFTLLTPHFDVLAGEDARGLFPFPVFTGGGFFGGEAGRCEKEPKW